MWPNSRAQLFRSNVIGSDWIKALMAYSKEKIKQFWNRVISHNPVTVLVLMWIKPSVCVVQNFLVGLGTKKVWIILIPVEEWIQCGFEEQNVTTYKLIKTFQYSTVKKVPIKQSVSNQKHFILTFIYHFILITMTQSELVSNSCVPHAAFRLFYYT